MRRIFVLLLALCLAIFMFPINAMADGSAETTEQPTLKGWYLIDGNWYYYLNGEAITGWLLMKQMNSWYYLNPVSSPPGAMVTGWLKWNDNWYYLSPDGSTVGAMVTGWQIIDGKQYYFKPEGDMAVGWQMIDGKQYYFGNDGSMAVGWKYIERNGEEGSYETGWYYFEENGDFGVLVGTGSPVIAVNGKNFPDPVFLAYVAENCDTDKDSYLNENEITAVTEIDVSGKDAPGNITTLQGIDFFIALKALNCDNNQLTELNMCGNSALESLSCNCNKLTWLNVNLNTKLLRLSCGMNRLTSLSVRNNRKLHYLDCAANNELTAIDVSECSNLEELYCALTRITSLDVTNNSMLRSLSCQGNAITGLCLSNNPALEYLDVAVTQLEWIDLHANANLKQLRAWQNGMTALDISSCPYLVDAVQNGIKTVIPQSGATAERVRYEMDSSGLNLYVEVYTNLDSFIVTDHELAPLILPENVNIVEDEAFAGTAIKEVALPENCRVIEACAFAYCKQLRIINIPDGIKQIADDAFYGSDNVVLFCKGEGYGSSFAKSHGIPFTVIEDE